MSYVIEDYPYTFNVTYVLKLEDDCWYVGKTKNSNIDKRVEQHLTQCGTAGWCYKHKPIKVQKIFRGDREEEITRKMIDKFGKDYVRGSRYVKVDNPDWNDHPKHTHKYYS